MSAVATNGVSSVHAHTRARARVSVWVCVRVHVRLLPCPFVVTSRARHVRVNTHPPTHTRACTHIHPPIHPLTNHTYTRLVETSIGRLLQHHQELPRTRVWGHGPTHREHHCNSTPGVQCCYLFFRFYLFLSTHAHNTTQHTCATLPPINPPARPAHPRTELNFRSAFCFSFPVSTSLVCVFVCVGAWMCASVGAGGRAYTRNMGVRGCVLGGGVGWVRAHVCA